MDRHELAGRLEHTILQAQLLPRDVHAQVTAAMQAGVGGVVVLPVWVGRVATMLREAGGVRTMAAVGFPLGGSKSTVKAIEATSCVKDGAEGLWVVPHLPNLLRADLDATKFELLEIVRAARAARRDVQVHVVVEVEMLVAETDGQRLMETACRAVRESACDGIVAGSGYTIVATDVSDETIVDAALKSAGDLPVTMNARSDDPKVWESFLGRGAHRVASDHAAEVVSRG